MKRVYEVVLAIVSLLLIGGSFAFGQGAHLVHYEAIGKLDSKRPDFTNAVIAIDFGGPVAKEATKMFRGLGAQNFSVDEEGSHPCVPNQEIPTLICIHLEAGRAIAVSEWGSSSGYGRNGGVSEQSSFSGSLYSINLTATLVRLNANGSIEKLDIGATSILAPDGSSYESIGSYGRNGNGGITSMNVTSGLNATIGVAVEKDLIALLGPGWKRVLLAQKIPSQWIPGADQEVALAFPKAGTK